MSNLAKTSTGIGGGGLIIGSGVALEEYLLDEEEEIISVVSPVVVELDEEGSVKKALKDIGLEIAEDLSDYETIYKDLMSAGTIGWAQPTMKKDYKIVHNNSANIPSRMKSKCEKQMKRKTSEFSDLKGIEFRTIKLVCTKNYSLTHNAKDYLASEDLTIHSENQDLSDSRWGSKLSVFKSQGLGDSFEDMKTECLKFGKELYRQNSPNRDNFYRFCVAN